MTFRITTHAGHEAPQDALERLMAELGERRGAGRFHKVGREIRATWYQPQRDGWDRPELLELERSELLELLGELCAGAPALELDWYAIGPLD